MDVTKLSNDELIVEFEIRNLIDASTKTITEALKVKLAECLEAEKIDPFLTPLVAHAAAQKNPKPEAAICGKKLNELKQQLLTQTTQDEVNPVLLAIVQTKLIHIQGRLVRLASSYATRFVISKLFKALQSLTTLVRETIANKNALNDSVDKLADIDIPNMDEGKDESLGSGSGSLGEIGHNSNSPAGQGTPIKTPPSKSKDTAQETQADFLNRLDKLSLGDQSIRTAGREAQDHSGFPNLPYGADTRICELLTSWNIKFGGLQSSVRIERFFYRIERLAEKSGIPFFYLSDYLSLCLVGELTLDWYWTYMERTKNVTWPQLKEAMIQRFQKSQSDDDIRRTLNQRKQSYPQESFLEFYDDILQIALQAKRPLSDMQIRDTLKRNMRPGLQLELHGLDESISLASFVKQCVALEDTWGRFGYNPEANMSIPHTAQTVPANMRFPPRNFQNGRTRFQGKIHELEEHASTNNVHVEIPDDEQEEYTPEICAVYGNPKQAHPGNQNYSSHQPQRSAQITNYKKPDNHRENNTNNYMKCWNCGNKDHVYHDCCRPIDHVFCFGCGADGIYKPECPRCNGRSGNRRSETGNTRNPILAEPQINPSQQIGREDAASNTDPELYRRQRREN